jgi:tetratricopeptide (TPR) repeat protein
MKTGTRAADAQTLLILLFSGSVYLSAFAFNDAPRNDNKLIQFSLLVVLYFIFRLTFQVFHEKRRHIQTGLNLILLLTGFVEAVWGLRQLYGFSISHHALFRLTGSFFNPGPYAGYLAVVFPMALYYGLKKGTKACGIIVCVAIFLVIPATLSRASWVAILAGSVVAVWGSGVIKIRVNQRFMAIAAALILAAGLAGIYFIKKDSADGRLLIWEIALKMLVHNPLGVGLGNFSGAYGETQAAYFASGQASENETLIAGNPEYGFNEFLQIGVESGIAALLLFIGILLKTFRRLKWNGDWGAIGSLTALLVFACFSYPFSLWPFLIVLAYLLAVGSGPCIPLNRKAQTAFLTLFFFAGVFGIYKQYPVYQARKQWRSVQMYYHSKLYEKVIETYGPLYPALNDRVDFLFEYAQSLSRSGRSTESNAILQRAMRISCDPMLYNIMGKNHQAMQEYEAAEAAFLHSTCLVPSRLYPWYLLAKLYDEMHLPEKASAAASVVLTKEPKVQSPAIKEMRREVRPYLLPALHRKQ